MNFDARCTTEIFLWNFPTSSRRNLLILVAVSYVATVHLFVGTGKGNESFACFNLHIQCTTLYLLSCSDCLCFTASKFCTNSCTCHLCMNKPRRQNRQHINEHPAYNRGRWGGICIMILKSLWFIHNILSSVYDWYLSILGSLKSAFGLSFQFHFQFPMLLKNVIKPFLNFLN